ncbi:WD40 repeat-like protein [Xylariaceae sp. FL0016]|nr:WD40 repeat-like protein [Xylariaceae sp. FL0016]
MSSFFTLPSQKKRKRAPGPDSSASYKKRNTNTKATKTKSALKAHAEKHDDDESISGSESEDSARDAQDLSASGSDSENEGETAAEKRLRLAEQYLDNVRKEIDTTGFDAKTIDEEILAERRAIADTLHLNVAESKGKIYKRIASEYDFSQGQHTMVRCNTQAGTSVAVSESGPFIYAAHKDALVKWKIQPLPADQYPQTTKKKPKRSAPPRRRPVQVGIAKVNSKAKRDRNYQGHVGDILCVAASHDGKYVATGGADHRVVVWDAKSLKCLKVFHQHRGAVNGLVFRRGTNTLYTAASDRQVKVFAIDALAYVETLYGHADEVADIDALAQERCISVGSRDRTCRLWKVVEESQLVFRGGSGPSPKKFKDMNPKSLAHEGSMDRVAQLDDQHFVTGSDTCISLWSIQKKKALHTVHMAHGLELPLQPTEASAEEHPDPKIVPPPQPRWITALRAVPFSDLVLSGSWDGYVRAWRFDESKKVLEPVGILGNSQDAAQHQVNGNPSEDSDGDEQMHNVKRETFPEWKVKGAINDIAILERGDKGKESLTVVCAVGKELRLGKWKKIKGGKNGTVVFEIPKAKKRLVNGDAEKTGEETA